MSTASRGKIVVVGEQRGRVPPHNLEAEESLLGAMLLSRDAITSAARAGVEPGDFYRPVNGHVYEAVVAVHGRDEPADPVTVAEELRRAGTLDGVGGRVALSQIQANTPASANAGHYARIVAELASMRLLIGVAGDIAEMGYDTSDDVSEVLDKAEVLLSAVTERRATIDVATDDLADLWDLDVAERERPSKPWVIPGCLRVGETFILTGSEGGGKMLWLRQTGACVASGIHPMTGLGMNMERHRVLALDLQEDRVDQAAEVGKLRQALAEDYEPGWYRSVSWPTGVDLLSPRGRRQVEGALEQTRPELVILGPLVKAFRTPTGQSRYAEDVVDEVTAVLDEMMVRYEFALMIEAHPGNARGSDEDWRVRGSAVWRSWPAFSHGLKIVSMEPREAEVVRSRPDRYADRAWPTRLFASPGWRFPWRVAEGDYERVCRAMGLGWLIDGAEQTTIDVGDEPF